MSAKPKAAIPAGEETRREERAIGEPFLRKTDDYFQPGGTRRHVLGQGKAFVYMSDDGTEIVTERPDGAVEKQPIALARHGKPVHEA